MIPKIIHQLDEAGITARSIQDLNPSYQYMFWTKSRINQLLDEKLYQKYQGLNIDYIAKFIILHAYGGFFWPSNLEPLKSIPDQLLKETFIVTEHRDLLASEPENPKLLSLIDNPSLIIPTHSLLSNSEPLARIMLQEPPNNTHIVESNMTDFLTIIICLSVFAFVLLIVIIVLAIVLAKKKQNYSL